MSKGMVPELLVPVGNDSHLKAAVANGADAVYMGLQAFNARIGAKNFSDAQFKEGVDYCHIHGVKVYLVLNTLLNDTELPAAIDMAKKAYLMGVDAVIVQDLGLMIAIRKLLPDLDIHASTQTTVLNSESAAFFKDLGLPRVILAREMSLKEIEHMHQNVDVELESFVHGAMCVSYSGQCLASALSFKRSGNRGRCAQNCRMNYKLEKDGQIVSQPTYFLSAKDLEALNFLPQIAKAGIVSFKIEGRKKSTEYVAIATRMYRKAIDHFFNKGPPVTEEEKKLLHIAFNRKLAKGHFFGKDNTAIFSDYPGSMGLQVGVVEKFERGVSTILVMDDFKVWDVLSVKHSEERVDFPIKEIFYQEHPVLVAKTGKRVQLNIPLREGLELFKTQDRRLTELTEESLKKEPPIRVQLQVELSARHFKMTATHQSTTVELISEIVPVKSQKPFDPALMKQKVSELGELAVFCDQLDIKVDSGYFVPVSAIKALKRDVISLLRQQIASKHYHEMDEGAFEKKKESFFAKRYHFNEKRTRGLTVKVGNWQQLEQALSVQPQTILVDADWPLDSLNKAFNACQQKGIQFVVSLPAILKDVEQAALIAKLNSKWIIQVNDWGSLRTLAKKKFKLWAGPGLNAFNSTSINYLSQFCDVVHPSLELTLKQLEKLREATNAHLDVTVFELGRVMTCEANPLTGQKGVFHIVDQNQWKYLVESDARDRLLMYNPLPLNMIPELKQFFPIADSVQVDVSKQPLDRSQEVLDGVVLALEGKKVLFHLPFTRGQFEHAV